VYVTHDQTEAMTMGDRVAVMREGQLEQVDTPQALYARPRNLFVAGFIGSPAMNFVSSTLVAENGSVYARLGESRLRLPESAARATRTEQLVGRPVILGVRPEDIEDVAYAPSPDPASTLDVTVSLAEPMGAEVIAHFDLGVPPVHTRELEQLAEDVDVGPATAGGERTSMVARLNPRSAAHPGGPIRLAVDAERVHLFDPETERAVR
jgi:multiple sugar transport system ATP-binding protein